jgi:hypothetical protein
MQLLPLTRELRKAVSGMEDCKRRHGYDDHTYECQLGLQLRRYMGHVQSFRNNKASLVSHDRVSPAWSLMTGLAQP